MADPDETPGRRQLAFAFSHRPSQSGEDFIVAPSNAAAVTWIDAWPAWPAPALVVYGPPGCGKSHLASVWQARTGALRLALPATDRFDPLRVVGAAAAAVIEDVERWIAADEAQRQLFHLYNVLAERGGHLMLTARLAPALWPMRLADLRSRVAAAPAAAIEPPDEDLMAALLMKLFADRQLKVGEEVLTFLLARMDRSFDAARRLVAALDEAALHDRRNLTVPLAGEVLRRVGPDGKQNLGRQGRDGGHGDDTGP